MINNAYSRNIFDFQFNYMFKGESLWHVKLKLWSKLRTGFQIAKRTLFVKT